MQTYHHPYKASGPDHHPLYDHDLAALQTAFVGTDDFFIRQSIRRRIEQAVPGMTAPLHAASQDAQSRARRAVMLFERGATGGPEGQGDTAAMIELRAFLSIDPGQLDLGFEPRTAA